MAVASLVGCSWCLDFGYFQAHNEGLDETKAREVPRWRESDVFTPLERDVMEYAEAMTQTPPTVTDELSARLLEPARRAGAGGAHRVRRRWRTCTPAPTPRSASSRRGSRRPVTCKPLAVAPRPHDRGPVRHPPQPALHRRLRDARLRRRRRGRRPGDLAAVGRRRPRRGARPAGLPGPDRHPAGAQPAADAWRGGARSTSGSGCPSRC